MSFPASNPSVLLVGASRGIGLAMVEDFAKRGWSVVGTVRENSRSGLDHLAEEYIGKIEIELLDIAEPAQIIGLRQRLAKRKFDIVFINAGVSTGNEDETIAQVSTDEFIRVMVTNALSPMRVVEGLEDLVSANGLIGVMSSGQGSVSNNERGGYEVYRASKAALNMLMRSYAARHRKGKRTLLLMAPGWIRTGIGGERAPHSVEETVPKIVETLLSQMGKVGLYYIDREGRTVPW